MTEEERKELVLLTKGLSTRASNIIFHSWPWVFDVPGSFRPKISSKEDVRSLLISGEIRKLMNCGNKTILEFCAWVGVKPEQVPGLVKRPFVCPHCGVAVPGKALYKYFRNKA